MSGFRSITLLATISRRYQMTLEEAITAYGRANFTETNDWYQWRPINRSYVPAGIVLPEGNHFAQNVALKMQLSALYSYGNNQIKKDIIHYYITIWGGIKRNSDEKIRSYALDTPASLIAKGFQGIASWSKALCIRCRNEFSIYDARVALSLNCLQIVMAVDRPTNFLCLLGKTN
jgi:hypothetical protein